MKLVESQVSLYSQSICSVAKNLKTLNEDWKCCPDVIVFDILFELYLQEYFDLLAQQLKDFNLFSRLLKERTCKFGF